MMCLTFKKCHSHFAHVLSETIVFQSSQTQSHATCYVEYYDLFFFYLKYPWNEDNRRKTCEKDALISWAILHLKITLSKLHFHWGVGERGDMENVCSIFPATHEKAAWGGQF